MSSGSKRRVGGLDFQPWTLFSLLDPPFLHSLRLSCVFGNLGNESILITEDDQVFALGSNGAGCLGLGDMNSTLEPKKVEALSGKVRVKPISLYIPCSLERLHGGFEVY
jgi:hypothetical protein